MACSYGALPRITERPFGYGQRHRVQLLQVVEIRQAVQTILLALRQNAAQLMRRSHPARWLHMCVTMRYSSMIARKDVGLRIAVVKKRCETFQDSCLVESRRALGVLPAFIQPSADRHYGGL